MTRGERKGVVCVCNSEWVGILRDSVESDGTGHNLELYTYVTKARKD